MALPAYSVDTLEEAESLQLLLCKQGYDGTYLWPDFGGELESLYAAGEILKRYHLLTISKKRV